MMRAASTNQTIGTIFGGGSIVVPTVSMGL